MSAPADVAGCEANQAVDLQRQSKGESAFKTIKQLPASATGAFSSSEKVKKTAKYRAVLTETSACGAATSDSKQVKAKKKKRKKK